MKPLNQSRSDKPFCITQHEWSCESFYEATVSGGVILLQGDYCVIYEINKQDAIAIAKALGVTGEDLL